MNTILNAIQSLISYQIILVFFILPVISDISSPSLMSNNRNKDTGQLTSSVPFSYLYYLPNRAIEEEFGSNHYFKSTVTKPVKLQRFYINYVLYDHITYKLFKFFTYSFIVILISYIQGISVISIPLGGHAPPKLITQFI